jgi:secernin
VGRSFAAGEKVFTQYLELPQARQVCGVLASQPAGCWGYDCGVNEHQVAAGCVALRSALRCPCPGLLGTDLVRLTLERSRTARQAVDLLTDLVERYGQGAFPGCPAEAERDNAFLIADPREAYAVEAAGTHWVYQEVRETRVVSNVRIVRQDWDRISHGLAAHAIAQGWWPEDGSKLDFSGALGETPGEHAPALRRWGQKTLPLVEQSGHIDAAFFRRVLNEKGEGLPEERIDLQAPHHPLFRPVSPVGPAGAPGVTSIVVQMRSDPARLPVVWWAIGAPAIGIHFPIFPDGDLPALLGFAGTESSSDSLWRRAHLLGEQLRRDPQTAARTRDRLARLQARFDQDAEEFAAEGAALKQRAPPADWQRQAGLFMQYQVERLEEVMADALLARSFAAVET